MAIRDRQTLITDIVSKVLNQSPQLDKTFDWFINKHGKEYFGGHFALIDKLSKLLKGDTTANQTKRTKSLNCDAYFGGQSNFMFEFDEFQHFSSARQLTIEHYPDNLKLNFSSSQWKQTCSTNKAKADKYRHNKTTVDFAFAGGRTFQRAYLDCFRDLLPTLHGLRPTLRINEFEVADIYSSDNEACKKVEKLIKSKLIH